jgi:protein-disulfide isomerase
MKNWIRYGKWMALPLTLLLPLGAADKGITKKQADEILDELRQIRQLLERQQAGNGQPEQPTRAKVGTAGAFAIGSKDAPITMVEFTDFQCPFCQRFHQSTFSDLKKNYIDTGKVRFVSRDLPLDFHPNAMQAAEAGRCAGEQGQFWPMRDWMGSNPDQLDLAHLLTRAIELKLNAVQFHACVTDSKYKDAIQADILEATKVGASGTPSFVIGKTAPDTIDGELIIGAVPFAVFDEKFKELAR